MVGRARSTASGAAAAAIGRAVRAARASTGLPVVFGGPVEVDGLRLTTFSGTATDSLRNLVVGLNTGLGGRAAALGRPVAVTDYSRSVSISHEYDVQVRREGLISLIAVPVFVGRDVRAVLYGALRTAGGVGDRSVDGVVQAARELSEGWAATGAAVPEQARRAGSRWELYRIAADLRGLAHRLDDDVLRRRILAVADTATPIRQDTPGVALSPRQLDVLALVASGCSNSEIAEELGIAREAVKSALRGTMRKLGVRTRHAAVSAARASGQLP
jgi:DNA-binding CsgD family transcriptional regulator